MYNNETSILDLGLPENEFTDKKCRLAVKCLSLLVYHQKEQLDTMNRKIVELEKRIAALENPVKELPSKDDSSLMITLYSYFLQ